MLFPDGPMIVSSWPIMTSEMNGLCLRGTLIMGRSLDNFKIRQFAEITKLSLVTYEIGDEHMPLDIREASVSLSKTPIIVKRLNNNIIAGYALIKDIFGKPVLILRVDQPRTIYKQSLFTIYHLIVSLFYYRSDFCFCCYSPHGKVCIIPNGQTQWGC